MSAFHKFTEPHRPYEPEWTPTHTLDRQVAEMRRQMGEARWNRLMKDWEGEQ